jgi:hypothetical protein
MRHPEVQRKGRDEILADYHFCVGQITADDRLPEGYTLTEQRLDETEVGDNPRLTPQRATLRQVVDGPAGRGNAARGIRPADSRHRSN